MRTDLEEASAELTAIYIEQAMNWYDMSRLTFMSFRTPQIHAVAEYLANQNGKTLIPYGKKEKEHV